MGKKLSELLTAAAISYTRDGGKPDEAEIADIAYDSRKAKAGVAFICLTGARADGHAYASRAYENGSRVFFAEHSLPELAEDCTVILFENTRAALPYLSAALFDFPQKRLHIVGITGTKGKTTVASLAYALLNGSGIPCGMIGTSGIFYGDNAYPTANTTPESYELMRTFRGMVNNGIRCAVIEVSSQALFNHRVDGIDFDLGVFTNLSPDHIGENEHPDFEHYKNSKKRLFSLCKTGLFNADDPYASEMQNGVSCHIESYALDEKADFTAVDVRPYSSPTVLGMAFTCRNTDFTLRLPGRYNVSDALCAIAIAAHFTDDFGKLSAVLAGASVKGRFQIIDAIPDMTVIIDYAHNYISLKNLLETVRAYQPRRMVCLFGSVGGRTQLRRGELGQVAAEYADFAIITSDNPDFEDPDAIIADIAKSFQDSDCPYRCIPDRRQAILYALAHRQPGDVLLLCGKGHENYQLIRGIKEPFSEERIVYQYANELKEDKNTQKHGTQTLPGNGRNHDKT